jgi:hypothetical protein
MRSLNILILLFLLLTYSYSGNKIVYLEPVPGANLVNTENNIIIAFEKPVNLSGTELKNSIIVTGSKSMLHDGQFIICRDNKRIIFKPAFPFEPGETINVKLTRDLLKSVSTGMKEYSFSFRTATRKIRWDSLKSVRDEIRLGQMPLNNNVLPPDIPQLTVTVNKNPSDGYMFIAPYSYATYLIITDKNGNPFWYSPGLSYAADFKKQPNSDLTYYDGAAGKHYELDANYNIVNSYYCGNGYTTDVHELRVVDGGYAYVMAYDPEIMDMSKIVPGGDTNAIVVGFIIQKIDPDKNVVFQWRSWDHFAITDAWHQNLDSSYIDCVHGNAIEIDNDTNLIISSRHLDEITKINYITGDIIWRFGGKNNQFTFLGDTLKFTYQHAIRRIANGNLTLYDNGNFHSPPYSRAVEYALDENNKTANAVWEYRNSPDIFGSWGGYVQRLANGNTLISWGGTNPTITEVDQNGNVVFEAWYPQGIFTYRAYKFDWNGSLVSNENLGNNAPRSFELKQNYPNPFNPSTSIKFAVPKRGLVKLVIYDLLGKEIRTILNEVRDPGRYTVAFDASDLSSGVYFYKILSGEFTDAKKMIILK